MSAAFDGRSVVYDFGELDAAAAQPAVHRRDAQQTASHWWVRRRQSPWRCATCRGTAGGRGWPNGSAPQKIRPPVGPKGNRSPADRLRLERLCQVPHRFMSMQQEHQRVKKADLANRIADELGITKARAEDAVDAILDEVKTGPVRRRTGHPPALRHLPSARQTPAVGAQSQDGQRSRHPGQTGGTVQGREVFQGCGQRRWLV